MGPQIASRSKSARWAVVRRVGDARDGALSPRVGWLSGWRGTWKPSRGAADLQRAAGLRGDQMLRLDLLDVSSTLEHAVTAASPVVGSPRISNGCRRRSSNSARRTTGRSPPSCAGRCTAWWRSSRRSPSRPVTGLTRTCAVLSPQWQTGSRPRHRRSADDPQDRPRSRDRRRRPPRRHGRAVAAESDTTPATPTPTAGPTSATPHHAEPHGTAPPRGRHANVAFPGEFAQWTTFDAKTNTSTVHDGIRGQVSAVSATSITVKAANGTPRPSPSTRTPRCAPVAARSARSRSATRSWSWAQGKAA